MMDVVEIIARGIAGPRAEEMVQAADPLGNPGDYPAWMLCQLDARRVVESLGGAGFAIVPVTPSEEMLEDGAHCASTVPIPNTADRIYRTMVETGRTPA